MNVKPLLSLLMVGSALSGCLGAQVDGVTGFEQALGVVQQGVDRAGAFSAAEATKLKSSYGLTWTGVYLGGPCSAGYGWNVNSVNAIYNATKWGFLPIYVG